MKFIVSERKEITGTFRIIDLGGRADYWQRVGIDFLDLHDVTVTCVNASEAEFYGTSQGSGRIETRIGDARAMVDLGNLSYHFVHSNSVIEHVGSFADMRDFANEVRRLGVAYYVQTPYFWFPFDPHWPRMPFFHWMPGSTRQKLLRRFSLGWGGRCRDVDHAMRDLQGTSLLDWSQMSALFPDAKLRAERFSLLPKSMIAERASCG